MEPSRGVSDESLKHFSQVTSLDCNLQRKIGDNSPLAAPQDGTGCDFSANFSVITRADTPKEGISLKMANKER